MAFITRMLMFVLAITAGTAHGAPSISTGTGFFIATNGYLITAEHVISGAEKISIKATSGEIYQARVVRIDQSNDIALLKVDGRDFRALPIGNSTSIRKGEDVFTIGYPLLSIQGMEQKVTNGIISSHAGLKDDPRFFQISVPVQSGNSGGPLVTHTGLVVGLISSKLNAIAVAKATGDLVQNANYAVKSNYILELINSVTTEPINRPQSSGQTMSLKLAVGAVEKAIVLVVASSDKGPESENPAANKGNQAGEKRKQWVSLGRDSKRQWHVDTGSFQRDSEYSFATVIQDLTSETELQLGGTLVKGIKEIHQTLAVDCARVQFVFPASTFMDAHGNILYTTTAPRSRWSEKIRPWQQSAPFNDVLRMVCNR
jgi:hypothetical protein